MEQVGFMGQIRRLLANMPASVGMLTDEEFEAEKRRATADALATLAEERKANKQAATHRVLAGAGIPARYRNALFANSDTASNPVAWKIAESYARGFGGATGGGALGVGNGGGGMLLWGDVGTGKTHLACVIGNYLIAKGNSVIYTSTFELIAGVKSSWRAGKDDGTEDGELAFYRKIQKPDLLILDEIGVQNNTDFERVVLSTVIDGRSRECKPIIAISNLAPAQIVDVIGQRAFDRLVGFGGEIIKFTGASRRVSTAGR